MTLRIAGQIQYKLTSLALDVFANLTLLSFLRTSITNSQTHHGIFLTVHQLEFPFHLNKFYISFVEDSSLKLS